MTATTAPITHEELRKRAIRWLTNTKHCGVVLSEMHSLCSEIPDAVGWQHCASHVVECKVSRSDFLANRDKPHVRTQRGVGNYRYILCPGGMLTAADVEGTDYGLLTIEGTAGAVRVKRDPTRRESCREDEIVMLVSALRRVQAREFLVIVPPAKGEDLSSEVAQ